MLWGAEEGGVSAGSFQTLSPLAGWWHRLCSWRTLGKNEQEMVRGVESKPYDSICLQSSTPLRFFFSVHLNLLFYIRYPHPWYLILIREKEFVSMDKLLAIICFPLPRNFLGTKINRGNEEWFGPFFNVQRGPWHLVFSGYKQAKPCFGLFSRKSTGSPQRGLCGSHRHRGNPRMLRSRPPGGVRSCYCGSADPLPRPVPYRGHFGRGKGGR